MSKKEFEVIVAAAPREKLMSTKLDILTPNIASGTQQQYNIFAPPGTIGRVQSLYIEATAPVGATSGNQEIVIGSTTFAGSFIYGMTSYNKNIQFNRFSFLSGGDLAIYPNDLAGMVTATKDIMFDDVTGLYLIYINNTNAVQNGTLRLYANWIKREVS